MPFIINQRTCFKGGVYLYTSMSLAHLWFVLVGVILLFLSFVAWYIDQYLIIGIKISMWKLGLGGEWFWCLRSSSTSVPGEMLCSWRPNGLFSCRRCSLSYRGRVDAWGRPHGEGSWADEFFGGEYLQGIWVEGELLGKFQSRETGTNAAFNQLPLDRLWSPCFTAFRPDTGKSRLLRSVEPSKFPHDASSRARRAQLRIRVQASRTSAYFGRASFEGKYVFFTTGLHTHVSQALPWRP